MDAREARAERILGYDEARMIVEDTLTLDCFTAIPRGVDHQKLEEAWTLRVTCTRDGALGL